MTSAFKDPNPFLGPSMEPDALLRSAVPPPSNKEPGRMGGSGRSLAPLHFPSELLPFDEALRDVCTIRPLMEGDVVARHGGQLLEMKAAERRGKRGGASAAGACPKTTADSVCGDRNGEADEDREPVCDLAAEVSAVQHAHICEYAGSLEGAESIMHFNTDPNFSLYVNGPFMLGDTPAL